PSPVPSSTRDKKTLRRPVLSSSRVQNTVRSAYPDDASLTTASPSTVHLHAFSLRMDSATHNASNHQHLHYRASPLFSGRAPQPHCKNLSRLFIYDLTTGNSLFSL
ncbi:hypothetical protein U1Q18_050747, partial [Sarracenia purpurea var. burkii]